MSFRFSATGTGIRARAGKRELAVLRAVPGFLSTLVDDPFHEVHRHRNPAVYADDDAASSEFHRLADSDVDEARRRDRQTLEMVLDRMEGGSADVSEEEAEAVLRAIGSARIALAARNGLFEHDELPAEPSSPQHMLVAFLGMVQEDLIDALSTNLPEGT